MSSEETILYRIGEIPVRKSNSVRITYNEADYKRLAEIAVKTGLAISNIITLLSQVCPVCGNEEIIISIPKNLLSTKNLNNGYSTTNRLNNGKQE